MKHLPFVFTMLALAAVLAAIWRPDYVWPCGMSAVVFIIAAAGFAGRNQVQK